MIELIDKSNKKRILLGQLYRRGDCLYATAVARQIKEDFPGSHLTWAISSMCRSVIEGNPYVDEIWELPLHTNEDIVEAWNHFETEAVNRKIRGDYDEIYLTQVHPGNFQNYDGTNRSSVFRGYPRPITVPVQPVIRLSDSEVTNVRRFADLHQLEAKKHVVLFECASSSGQSFVDQRFALAVAREIVKNNENVCFVLSSDKAIQMSDKRIIDGSVLSFKENAELTKYCSLLIGCSSGISWLSTSDWAKPLPKIQLLHASTVMFASMIHDALYFGLPTDQIIEMQNCRPEVVSSCVQLILKSGFSSAKLKYHQDIPVNFSFYFKQLYWELLRKDEFGKAAKSLSVTRARFGDHPQLIHFIQDIFFPYLDLLWQSISKDDQDRIIGLLPYNERRGSAIIPRNIVNAFMIFKAIFHKDTCIVGMQMIKNIALRVFNALRRHPRRTV